MYYIILDDLEEDVTEDEKMAVKRWFAQLLYKENVRIYQSRLTKEEYNALVQETKGKQVRS